MYVSMKMCPELQTYIHSLTMEKTSREKGEGQDYKTIYKIVLLYYV